MRCKKKSPKYSGEFFSECYLKSRVFGFTNLRANFQWVSKAVLTLWKQVAHTTLSRGIAHIRQEIRGSESVYKFMNTGIEVA